MTREALQRDIWRRVMRIFDIDHRCVAWKRLRQELPQEFRTAMKEHGIARGRMRNLTSRLFGLRNKTMCHTDIEYVRNPKATYKVSPTEWRELDWLMEKAHAVLSDVYVARGKNPRKHSYGDQTYDASDVQEIIKAYVATKNPASLPFKVKL